MFRKKSKGNPMSVTLALKDRTILEVDPGSIDETDNLGRFLPRPRPADIEKLAASIKEYGQQTPVRLRPSKADPERYEIVAGQTRVAACRALGRMVVAEITRDDDEQALLQSIEENFRRGEVNVMDVAVCMQRLKKAKWSQRDIARHFAYTEARVSQMLSLLRLPQPAIDAIIAGGMSSTAALELTGLSDEQVAACMEVAYVTEPSAEDASITTGYYDTARLRNAAMKFKAPPPPLDESTTAASDESAATADGSPAPAESKNELREKVAGLQATVDRFAPASAKIRAIAATVADLPADGRELLLSFAGLLSGESATDDVVLAAAKLWGFDPNICD